MRRPDALARDLLVVPQTHDPFIVSRRQRHRADQQSRKVVISDTVPCKERLWSRPRFSVECGH
jgi:hypothetical protein